MRYFGMILLKYKIFPPHVVVFQKYNLKISQMKQSHNTPDDKLKAGKKD